MTATVICQQCGKAFDVKPYRAEIAKYCSLECRDLAPHAAAPPDERFWSKVDCSGDCWIWTAAINNKGYGVFHYADDYGKASTLAHRYSWQLHNGAVPSGMCVCHRCDNPACVNPAHLWLGTIQDNSRDMVAKERHPSHIHPHLRQGERHGMAKLTENQVRDIRTRLSAGIPMMVLAQEFNVTHGTISLIRHRKIWKHVE